MLFRKQNRRCDPLYFSSWSKIREFKLCCKINSVFACVVKIAKRLILLNMCIIGIEGLFLCTFAAGFPDDEGHIGKGRRRRHHDPRSCQQNCRCAEPTTSPSMARKGQGNHQILTPRRMAPSRTVTESHNQVTV